MPNNQSSTVRFTLADLQAKARERKPGYVAEVLALARRNGDSFELSHGEAARIRVQFSLPSVLGNAARAGGRVLGAALSGKKISVSEEERSRRKAICSTCEFFTGVTCLKCGCVIRFKSLLATEHCPIAKW